MPTKAFTRALVQAIASARGNTLVIDVGANDGRWSAGLLNQLKNDADVIARLTLYMIEPQPFFISSLEKIERAYRPRVRYLRAAAWTHATRLTLHSARPSQLWKKGETASLMSAYAKRHGASRRTSVPPVDR